MIVIVVGLPGVGKTSVINNAKKYFKTDFDIINFGDIIFEVSKEKYAINDRDDIRKKLSREEYIAVQRESAERIKKISENKNIILDTHLFIETNFGFFSGTPEFIADILRPDCIIVVTAPPEQILERRLKDESRKRDIEDINRIKLHQDLTVMHAVVLAFKYQTIVEVVENPKGKLDEATKKFANIINNLF